VAGYSYQPIKLKILQAIATIHR